MKVWQVKYLDVVPGKNPIEKWLDALTREQLKSVAKEIKMLEEVGSELKLPHSRSLGKGLFELRERRYGYRVYYCFQNECVIVLLAAGDKKSQKNDIKIARERMLQL
jgi:putative addiction module killer protein